MMYRLTLEKYTKAKKSAKKVVISLQELSKNGQLIKPIVTAMK
jgi:hypothetical protein